MRRELKIEIRGLNFSYPDSSSRSIRDLDLSIEEGKNHAIMGKNGSGKTTLLKLIAGIHPPDSGSIEFIDGSGETEIGFSPEDPELGFFSKTVREEVEFYPKNLGKDHETIADKTLKTVGIAHLSEKLPTVLSSGQQRLVSIASVLSGQPEIIIMDEPTHSLHSHGEKMIGRILDKIDKTILFSTHSSDFAFEYADKAVLMSEGTVQKVGDVRDVLSDRELLKKFGIRIPGLVDWAFENQIEPIPESMEEASKLSEEVKD